MPIQGSGHRFVGSHVLFWFIVRTGRTPPVPSLSPDPQPWIMLVGVARVAELADALDLGFRGESRAGSSPASRIAAPFSRANPGFQF